MVAGIGRSKEASEDLPVSCAKSPPRLVRAGYSHRILLGRSANSCRSYERGTSLLFDDRVEEPVVLGAKHHGLPKKIPDRVFGLRLKGQLENLVTTLTNKTKNFGQPFECTPFRLATNPPVFPFLVLEAKADSSKNGFHDIETQTALPIRTFLEIQTRLKSETETTADDALVWFIGYRGSAWKVYGCYVDTVKGTTRYVSLTSQLS